jgi:putative glutamine amidotransferase
VSARTQVPRIAVVAGCRFRILAERPLWECVPPTVIRAVIVAGGRPEIITPAFGDLEFLSGVSGVVFCGGRDIDPELYGVERDPRTEETHVRVDEWERGVMRAALNSNRPILAICRGAQLMNVASGGGLIQHVDGHWGGTHRVSVAPGSLLEQVMGLEGTVNSWHHQVVAWDNLGKGVEVVATSGAGDQLVIEGIEIPGGVMRVGVQWHPEECSSELIRTLVGAAREMAA